MKTGIFPLAEHERAEIAAHFLRLPPRDRHLRFGSGLSDHAIKNFVNSLNLSYLTGYFLGGQLAAVSFIAPEAPGKVEFAISVDEKFRGVGIARRLLEYSIETLSSGARPGIVVRHASENAPIARLCSKFDASRMHEGPDVVATLDPWGSVQEVSRALELLCAAEG
jgi:GNAT superfamily N-acetyltransferase